MRRGTRAAAMALAAALGTGAAIAAAAGDDDVRACVVKRTGELHARAGGKCGRGAFAITIGGNAFKKSSRGGTLTINGVAFRRGRGQTLTINGTSFRTGTLPNTLTINGNSFQTGTLPQSLTINGNSFRSSGQTLTINGTSFEPGSAARPGPPGPTGPAGPAGPAATLEGPAPVEVAGPVVLEAGGADAKLASVTYGGPPHRLLISGGFSLACNGCANVVDPVWSLQAGGAKPLVSRRMPSMSNAYAPQSGATVGEVVVCGPCTIDLMLGAAGKAGGAADHLDATAIRLALTDLGPLSAGG